VVWKIVCPLQGEFKDFNASYKYVTPLGDQRLSVVDELTIHGLTHVVNDGGDDIPDFLADDYEDDFVGDTLYSSINGTGHPVSAVLNSQASEVDRVVVDVTHTDVTMAINCSGADHGRVYLRMNDPIEGNTRILKVVRGNGTELDLTNAWRTHRVIRLAVFK
jgi:hypothetical protein